MIPLLKLPQNNWKEVNKVEQRYFAANTSGTPMPQPLEQSDAVQGGQRQHRDQRHHRSSAEVAVGAR